MIQEYLKYNRNKNMKRNKSSLGAENKIAKTSARFGGNK